MLFTITSEDMQPGTPVTINGFNVGTVTIFGLGTNQENCWSPFQINKDFEFSKNSSAELYDTGIIGGKGIRVNPVFDGSATASSGDTLSTKTRPGTNGIGSSKS